MMRASRPLDRFPLVRTQYAEDMRAALERVYAKPIWHLDARTKKVDVTLNYYPMQHSGLGYTKYGVDLSLVYPESEWTAQTFPTHGRGELTVNKTAGSLDPRHGIAISPGTSFGVKLSDSYEHFILLLNTQALTAKLEALTGIEINRPLHLHAIRDDARPAGKLLRDHLLFLADSVDESVAPLPDWVLAESEQMLMVMSLYANRHNYSHLLERAPRRAGPGQLRRAQEYIEANWRGPIAMEALVSAAGVSVACLVQSLKESRGHSPTQFARRVRLDRARRLLRRPDGAATVADIAANCGFANLRRFIGDYMRAFGERPSLKRGEDADAPNH